MPLIEVKPTQHVTASVRLKSTNARQLDQYAAFIHATADDVVEQALAYVFGKDKDFQNFVRTPEAQRITPTLRIRRRSVHEPEEQPEKKPVAAVPSKPQTPVDAAGSRA